MSESKDWQDVNQCSRSEVNSSPSHPSLSSASGTVYTASEVATGQEVCCLARPILFNVVFAYYPQEVVYLEWDSYESTPVSGVFAG